MRQIVHSAVLGFSRPGWLYRWSSALSVLPVPARAGECRLGISHVFAVTSPTPTWISKPVPPPGATVPKTSQTGVCFPLFGMKLGSASTCAHDAPVPARIAATIQCRPVDLRRNPRRNVFSSIAGWRRLNSETSPALNDHQEHQHLSAQITSKRSLKSMNLRSTLLAVCYYWRWVPVPRARRTEIHRQT